MKGRKTPNKRKEGQNKPLNKDANKRKEGRKKLEERKGARKGNITKRECTGDQ